jgi:hypothetical protein
LGNYIVRLFFLIISIPYLYLLLTVNWLRPPVIIVGPSNQTVRIGADATFECKLLTNSLQPHTQWLQHFTFNGSYRDENGLPYVNIIQVIIFLHHFSNYYQDKTCRDDYFQLFNWYLLFSSEKLNSKCCRTCKNRSKMDILKVGVDDFNYFSLIFSYFNFLPESSLNLIGAQ